MIAIALRFPSGRFHATPWGRHVNEGAAEWPPSPWRLLRALVATWKRKLNAEFDESDIFALLTKMASPPSFVLPPASTGHSRHYMPWFKKGPDDRTLVFDAFVALSKTSDVFVVWQEEELSKEQRNILSRLVENLGFVGRSESWCDGRLVDEETSESLFKLENRLNDNDSEWCRPLCGDQVTRDQEVIRVLCPDPNTAFQDEHVVRLENVTSGRGKNKQTTTTRHANYEPNWNLCIETSLLHAEKWSDPPGSRWIPYVRSSNCFRISTKRSPSNVASTRPARNITIARYALDGPVLPLITDTLRLADFSRITLMGIFKRLKLQEYYGGQVPRPLPNDAPWFRSDAFSGKNEEGTPLTEHRHAYYLPTDEDGDGRLDHLTVFAEMGFGVSDQAEVRALDQFRRLRWNDGDPLNLLLVGLGNTDDFRTITFAKSPTWISATPFIAPRHQKSSGRKRDPVHLLGSDNQLAFVESLLREELDRLNHRRASGGREVLPAIVSIEPLFDRERVIRIDPEHWVGPTKAGPAIRPIQFKRFRQKRSDDGGSRPNGAWKIVFEQPAQGPITLGHSAHFGMGLFLPEWKGKQ